MQATTARSNHPTENLNLQASTLLTERLEQLGYQCLSDKCEQFTTMRLIPIETKQKEEQLTPPSE